MLEALKAEGLTVDPDPDGKIIEAVVVHRNRVLLPSDLALLNRVPVLSRFRALNRLHILTKDYIVRQELLFRAGDVFRRDIFEETGRNLRAMFILGIARLQPCRGSTPNRVVVLVVTKDNWTLRLNTNFFFDQARLDQLSFSIAESNLGGRNKTASFNFGFDPGRYAIGLGYYDPRIWSSRHAASASASILVNRQRGNYEGFYVGLSVGRPLYSLRTRWAWGVSASWLEDVFRDFREGALRTVRFGDDLIPRTWNRREASADAAVTRSFGVRDKLNLTLGWRVSSLRYLAPPEIFEGVAPGSQSGFEQFVMPRSENANGPYVGLSAFSARYVRMQNIHTFALSEDFRVGPTFAFEARWADEIFELGNRFLALSASFSDVRWVRDALFAFSAAAAGRIQTGVWPGAVLVNQDVSFAARHITPRFGPFRIHLYGSLRIRAHDLFHATLTIGGDSGLRAFPARAFPLSVSTGSSARYQVNAELRSVALNLWSLHVGGVIFYDGGDAPLSLLNPGWHHGAGVGLRILIPQFNREVLRLDLGFPFETYAGGVWSPRFTAEFSQAF